MDPRFWAKYPCQHDMGAGAGYVPHRGTWKSHIGWKKKDLEVEEEEGSSRIVRALLVSFLGYLVMGFYLSFGLLFKRINGFIWVIY